MKSLLNPAPAHFKVLHKLWRGPLVKCGLRGLFGRPKAGMADIAEPIRAIFKYLDASVPAKVLAEFDHHNIGIGCRWFEVHSPAKVICEMITEKYLHVYQPHKQDAGSRFRWGHYLPADLNAPIRKALDTYSLYHEDDMAPALTCAYHLYRQGKNPDEALRADYAWQRSGITLEWNSTTVLGVPVDCGDTFASMGLGVVNQEFARRYRVGDRLASWSGVREFGEALLRGERLVWQNDGHSDSFLPVSRYEVWLVERSKVIDQFDSMGGIQGFLAGKFDWYHGSPVGPDNPRPAINAGK